MQIQIKQRLLEGMAILASKDETRPIIMQILLELRTGTDDHTMVSTDGRRMAIVRINRRDGDIVHDSPEPRRVLLPIPEFTRLRNGIKDQTLTVHIDEDKRKITYTDERGYYSQHHDMAIGEYPKWEQVIPINKPFCPVREISVNTKLMNGFVECSNKVFGLKDNGIVLKTHGEGPDEFGESIHQISVFTSHADFYGILMPMRTSRLHVIPEWLIPAKQPEPQETCADDQVEAVEAVEAPAPINGEAAAVHG